MAVSTKKLIEARENLRQAMLNFDDKSTYDDIESEHFAFICLWDAVDNILTFLTEYTRKRRRGRPRKRPT